MIAAPAMARPVVEIEATAHSLGVPLWVLLHLLLYPCGYVDRVVYPQSQGQCPYRDGLGVELESSEPHYPIDPCDDREKRHPRHCASDKSEPNVPCPEGVDNYQHE